MHTFGWALPWLLPFLAVLRLIPRKPDLADAPERTGRPVSLIIPARNEATTIGSLLDSVLASEYTPLEILVVDDRSTDDTARIVQEFARKDPRVRLVAGTEPPAGWYGKPWACVQGYREATGELIAFTDADTTHRPGLLGHTVGALEEECADLVTPITRQLCVTFWERVVMPQVWIMLAVRYYPRRVNRATRSRDVIANGQFILMRREAYERAGTHEAVRHQVAEDLALAQAFLRSGSKLFLAYGETLIETRMYTSLASIVEGWSKNLYLGGQTSFPEEPLLRRLVPFALLGTMIFWLLPVLWLLAALAGLVTTLVASAGLAALLSACFWIAMSAGMRIPPWYGLLYPVGAATTGFIIARSVWKGARAVEWKGRIYSGLSD